MQYCSVNNISSILKYETGNSKVSHYDPESLTASAGGRRLHNLMWRGGQVQGVAVRRTGYLCEVKSIDVQHKEDFYLSK